MVVGPKDVLLCAADYDQDEADGKDESCKHAINAIRQGCATSRNRGREDSANADEGTIRKEYAESIEANSVHGSDSEENAAIEIAYFFKPEEIVG